MEKKLILISEKLTSDFKQKNEELDALIEKKFTKAYNKIVFFQVKNKAVYEKLYPYIYFHYC